MAVYRFCRALGLLETENDPLGANTDAYYPRVAFNGGKNTNVQTRYLQNGAYLRLKNIQLGYTLPVQWIQKAGMSSVRVYVSGDNLLTWSSLSTIFDPEATGDMAGSGIGKALSFTTCCFNRYEC